MAFPRTHRVLIADTGGHRDLHRSASFHRGGGVADAPATVASDHNPYPAYPGKHQHRPRPFTGADAGLAPPPKRRKAGEHDSGERYQHAIAGDAPSTSSASFPLPGRHDPADAAAHPGQRQPEGARSEEHAAFMSRDEIERCSPSRKDGIDSLVETHLRYSYCAYLQNLGMRLQLPQTTIGTAMVLCHRFFVHRSHASHDRFLISTAALFLASKSEETPCLLNTVLRASCEICQTQSFAFYPFFLCSQDWFEQYRERVIEAEQMILTTLDFELDVQHPYIPLTSVLNKLGLSQTVLMSLAWNLVSEGLRTSLWLQFKPRHIAAGAAFLAAKFLNIDLAFYWSICHEFQTTPSILQDVVKQFMELF